MPQSKFLRNYNRVNKAWANLLGAIVELFRSFFVVEVVLTSEDKEMQEELWNVIAKVVNTGPGPINVPAVTHAYVGNKTFFYRISYQWYLALPNHETVLIADPHGNRSNIVGVAKDIDLEFQRHLLADLKVWLEDHYKRRDEAERQSLYQAKHKG